MHALLFCKCGLNSSSVDSIQGSLNSAGITKEQVYKLWQSMFPHETESDFTEFEQGLSLMAKHVQFTKLDYSIGADLAGDDSLM